MNLRGKKQLALAVLTSVVALGGAWQLSRSTKLRRPQLIFVNKTAHHQHDLAFKMSLKLAESKAGIENALVLLDKLPAGMHIEEFAAQFFSSHKIGQRRDGKGLLLVYSEQENEFKIEVSYKLEPTFPDVVCHRLEEAARTYMLSEMPQDFISELLITMNNLQPNELGSPSWPAAQVYSGGAGVHAQGYRPTLEDYQKAILRLPSKALAAYAPSREAAETVRRYLRSLELGLGDPGLPLLTEGSQLFRTIVPRNQAQQRRVFEYLHSAGDVQLLLKTELGLALPEQGKSNLPLVLRHGRTGLWYIDEPKSWTYFQRYENSPDFWLKYDALPFASELRASIRANVKASIYGNRVAVPAPPAYPYLLAGLLKKIETNIARHPQDARLHAEAGDLYLFEVNWITRAVEHFEQATRLAPDEPQYHWRLADLYLNNSEVEKMLREYAWLARRFPKDHELVRLHQYYENAYQLD